MNESYNLLTRVEDEDVDPPFGGDDLGGALPDRLERGEVERPPLDRARVPLRPQLLLDQRHRLPRPVWN